jgi:hypothetical protein
MIAITRDVSPAVTRCELTHLERNPPSPGSALNARALRRAGVLARKRRASRPAPGMSPGGTTSRS